MIAEEISRLEHHGHFEIKEGEGGKEGEKKGDGELELSFPFVFVSNRALTSERVDPIISNR